MNSLRFSKRSGLVKLIEHQMQNKITVFFWTFYQIIDNGWNNAYKHLIIKPK